MNKWILCSLILASSLAAMESPEATKNEDKEEIISVPAQMNYFEVMDPYQPDPNDPQGLSQQIYFAVKGATQKSPQLEEFFFDRYIKREEARLNRELVSFLPHWYTVKPKSKYVGSSYRNDEPKAWFKFFITHHYSIAGIVICKYLDHFPCGRLKCYLKRMPGIVSVSDKGWAQEESDQT